MPYEQMMLAAAPVKEEFDRLLDRIKQKLNDLGVKATRITGPTGNQTTWTIPADFCDVWTLQCLDYYTLCNTYRR